MAPKSPTHNFTHTLIGRFRFESHRVNEFVLSRDHFVEVFVRVQIERGLNPRVTRDSLHGLCVLLYFIRQRVC
jgi:hypothetical protein